MGRTILLHSAPAKLPIIQKLTVLMPSLSFDKNIIKLVSDEHIELITIPANIILKGVIRPPIFAKKYTNIDAIKAPKNAPKGAPKLDNTPENPISIENVAPKDAPDDNPNI